MKTIYQLALQVLAVLVIAGCAEQKLGTTSSDQAFTESAEVLTLAERAGAPLFDGMGDYEMPITTQEQDAQRYFNQGMVLASPLITPNRSVVFARLKHWIQPAPCAFGEKL